MAKKEKETNSILDDIIEQEFTDVQDLSKEDDTIPYWVDTGNYALNYAISKKFRGGYPGGRISNLWGRSGTGKSMLPAIASKAKDEDGNLLFDRIIVVDSEGGGTGKSLFQFVNAPIERVRYVNISTLDSYRVSKETGKAEAIADKEVPLKLDTPSYVYHRGLISFMKKIIYALEYNKSTERVLFIIDSISNIKSVRQNIEGVEDMGKTNKLLNQFFGLDTSLHNIGATVLLASKVYTNLNNPYDPWIMAGGESVLYNPSLNLKLSAMSDSADLTDSQLKEEKERRKTALGNSLKVIRGTVTKSRFGTENRNVWFLLDATYGIVRNSGLFEMLLDFGAAKKNGTRYSIPGVIVNEKGEDITFYKKEFLSIFGKKEKEYIDKLQEVMDKIEEKIKNERISINVNDIEEAQELDEQQDDDEDVSVNSMLAAMEVEQEMDAIKESK